MKARKYQVGGKSPIVPDPKKMPNNLMASSSQDTTKTPPTVKLEGATVVAKKGQGLETQIRATVPANEYLTKEKELMDKELAKYVEQKGRGQSALKYITPTERSMMKDAVREEMYKQGIRKNVTVFKDTGKEATPEEVAKMKRLEEQRKKGY
jgi:hypothetical protein